ncbi:MAG: hypothetical protein ABSD56_09175 [Bryobacteraceae bacterium]
MAQCSPSRVFLELNKAQLDVIVRVLKLNPPVVEAIGTKYGMLTSGEKRPDIHTLYAVEIPEKPDRVRIYFTDAQKKQMQSAGNRPCDYFDVKSIGPKYGIVVPHMTKYGIPPPSAPKK